MCSCAHIYYNILFFYKKNIYKIDKQKSQNTQSLSQTEFHKEIMLIL